MIKCRDGIALGSHLVCGHGVVAFVAPPHQHVCHAEAEHRLRAGCTSPHARCMDDLRGDQLGPGEGGGDLASDDHLIAKKLHAALFLHLR